MFRNKINNFYIFFIIYLFFHLIFIYLDPINDEYIFYSGADFINTNSKEIIKVFFDYNANTLGFSYLIFLISKILNFEDYYTIGKLISLSGYIILYFGLQNFAKFIELREKEKVYVLLIIFFCPLIFTYGFRATPDFFSSTLAFYACSKLIRHNSLLKTIIFYILIAISVIIKPFNGIVLLMIFLCNLKLINNNLFIKQNLTGLIFFGIITSGFFFLNYTNYGFIFNAPQWQSTDINFENYFENIIYYFGYINLYIIPFTFKFFLNFKFKRYDLFILFVITFFVTLILFINWNDKFFGELNFGRLSQYVNLSLFKIFLGLGATYFIFYFYVKYKITKNIIYLNLFVFVFIYIAIMSFFMPAQRYTLILIPFLYMVALKETNSKFLNISTILLYFLINIIIFNNHLIISDLSKKTLQFINSKNIHNETYPGYFGQHSLSKFTKFYKNDLTVIKKKEIFRNNKKYSIVSSKKIEDDIIFYYKSKILFLSKEIFIVKNF